MADPGEPGYDAPDGATTNETVGKLARPDGVSSDPELIQTVMDRSLAFMRRQVAERHAFFVFISRSAVHRPFEGERESIRGLREAKKGEHHSDPLFAAMTADLDASLGAPTDGLEALGAGVAAGARKCQPIAGWHLLPTIADLAGGGGRLPAELDGVSLRDASFGRAQPALSSRPLASHLPYDRSPMRLGDLKGVKSWTADERQRFDLSTDIGGQKNQAATWRADVDRLEKKLDAYLEAVAVEERSAARYGGWRFERALKRRL